MLALFALGQHDALVAIQSRLVLGERLMAFLDDAVDERPDRTEAVYTAIEQELRFHTRIEVHHVEQSRSHSDRK